MAKDRVARKSLNAIKGMDLTKYTKVGYTRRIHEERHTFLYTNISNRTYTAKVWSTVWRLESRQKWGSFGFDRPKMGLKTGKLYKTINL